MAQLLEYRPGMFRRMPRFDSEFYDLPGTDINLAETVPGSNALNALAYSFTMTAEVRSTKWLLKSFAGYINSGLDPINCEGTREQLVDFCLLRLRGTQTNSLPSTAIKKLLGALTSTEPHGSYPASLVQCLQQRGCTNEADWIGCCMLSEVAGLSLQAIEAAENVKSARVLEAAEQLMIDAHVRGDVRAAAMALAAKNNDRRVFLDLCELLNDRTPTNRAEFLPMTQPGYPFSDRIAVQAALAIYSQESRKAANQTLGDEAQAQLKRLTKKDYGKDPQPWRKWIAAHPKAFEHQSM